MLIVLAVSAMFKGIMPHLMSKGSHFFVNKEAIGELAASTANIRSVSRKYLQRTME